MRWVPAQPRKEPWLSTPILTSGLSDWAGMTPAASSWGFAQQKSDIPPRPLAQGMPEPADASGPGRGMQESDTGSLAVGRPAE